MKFRFPHTNGFQLFIPLVMLTTSCVIRPSLVKTEYDGVYVEKPWLKTHTRSFPNASNVPMVVNGGRGEAYLPQDGQVGYYNYDQVGQVTASGEPFDPHALTAAHATLPFNTLVRVTRVDNQRSIQVRINDRGPVVAGRVIQLTTKGAKKLKLIEDGVAPCRVEILEYPAVEVGGPSGPG